jgi:uncharacterized repeat protein (TIGR03803 family)
VPAVPEIAANHRKAKHMRNLNFFFAAVFGLVLAVAMPLAQAQTFHLLHEFTGGADGAFPKGTLVRDQAGNLYGTTNFGGPSSAGVVYKIDPTGAETVLFAFDGANGATPGSALILDQVGNLYGTANGGPNDDGVVFRVSPSGEQTVLFDFPENTGIDPIFPTGSLTMDKRGNLYGATLLGGNGNCILGCGSIYRLDPTGNVRMLYQFTGGSDGFSPLGSLVADANGNLYGVAQVGGDFNCSTPEFAGEGCGTVFRLAKNGQFTVLHAFHGGTDGEIPQAGLLIDAAAGKLYGAASGGSGSGDGVVFQISSNGSYRVLRQFTGTDGSTPNGELILDEAGNIYGTTQGGGSDGLGTAFVMNRAGQLRVLHSFTGDLDGLGPLTGLTRDPAGDLFGTAFKNLLPRQKEGDVFEITH